LLTFLTIPLFAQSYREYNHKFDISAHLSKNSIFLQSNEKYYKSNTPVSARIGFSLKNTIVNIGYGFSLGDTFGESDKVNKEVKNTDFIDLKLHKYGQNYILDLFFQHYKGFYNDDKDKIEVYPDLTVSQYGAAFSYLFNGENFSSGAAFEQSQKQLDSAGSFIAGCGIYFTKVNNADDVFAENENYDTNLRIGISGGYAYSYVLSQHWLLSAGITEGFYTGKYLYRSGDLLMNFNTLLRMSIGYNCDNWGVSLFFTHNVYHYNVFKDEALSLNLNAQEFQIKYARRFY
jgi:hypothetical protein